jgi:hypothetical protein
MPLAFAGSKNGNFARFRTEQFLNRDGADPPAPAIHLLSSEHSHQILKLWNDSLHGRHSTHFPEVHGLDPDKHPPGAGDKMRRFMDLPAPLRIRRGHLVPKKELPVRKKYPGTSALSHSET